MRNAVGLAMIVRDCADTLGVCLQSVEGMFDQIVVVDTGSVDKTKQVAQGFDVELHDFKWVDDFSAARNYSFDLLKTPWAFWLDADDILLGREYLDELVDKCEAHGLHGAILEYLYSFDAVGEKVLADLEPHILSGAISPGDAYTRLRGRCVTTQYRERLVRRIPGWKWEYPIHEALPAAYHPLGKYDKMKIVHRRHLRASRAKDGDRNLRILLSYPEHKRDQRIWFYLGMEYAHHGRLSEAIEAFEKFVPVAAVEDEKYHGYCILADLYRVTGAVEKGILAALRAVEIKPGWSTAYITLVHLYAAVGDWNKVLHYGQQVSTAAAPHDTPFAYNPLQHKVAWVNDYVRALSEAGRLEEAKTVLEEALQAKPDDKVLENNYEMVTAALNQMAGVTSLGHSLEFLARMDNAETAAVVLGRLGPVLAERPAIKKWVEKVGQVCGPAARGEIPLDDVKLNPENLTAVLAPATDVEDCRIPIVMEEMSKYPDIVEALALGVPNESREFFQRIGLQMTTATTIKALEQCTRTFDAVILWGCLERVQRPGYLVEQARRLIRPGGYLMGSVSAGPSSKGLGVPDRLRLRAYDMDTFRQVMGTVRMPKYIPGWLAEAGNLWLTVPTAPPPLYPKDIAIVCPLAPEPWGPGSLGRGIGGSEEAVIRLSRAFSRRGHTVSVYQNHRTNKITIDKGGFGEVRYLPLSMYKPAQVMLGWRYPEIFTGVRPYEAAWHGLWMHDTVDHARVRMAAPVVDAIWAISDYHASLYADLPNVYSGRNGMDAWEMEDAESQVTAKNPYKCVYVSTPFRGLGGLLQEWPHIKVREPKAELHCYYGWEAADKLGATSTKDGAAFKQQVMERVNELGVIWHGRIGQPELYRELLGAGVWTYPTTHAEEHCISAYLTQAAGCWPVVYPLGALNQSVVFGSKVSGAEFVDAVIEKMHQEEGRQEMADWVRKWTSWDDVAAMWERLWRGMNA